MKNLKRYLFFLFTLLSVTSVDSRSPLRPRNKFTPTISTQWSPNIEGEKIYTLTEPHLELYPLFQTFDPQHFKEATLPEEPIAFRNDSTQTVDGALLKEEMETLLREVRAEKQKFKDFDVLKKRDFNFKKQAGLLVVKCKKYPFVVKLFMENPRSFVRPYNKGFTPSCIFVIGGGITRHTLGFTRIKNAYSIQKRLEESAYWANKLSVPRKWFWTPKNARWIRLDGYNIGNHDHITIEMPGTYAIIADYIDCEREFSLASRTDRRNAIDISNYFLCRIDPHINNFMVEKNTGKIVIIDTEHFPTLAGFKERPRMTSYTSWYLHLFTKYLKDRFGKSKEERIQMQLNPTPPFSVP